MRAREPEQHGYVQRDGVRVQYELFGSGDTTLLFMPTWSILHSRSWKAQIPYFAQHYRCLTFDPRGNGLSDRPQDPAAYSEQALADDALAILDHTGTAEATVLCFSRGTHRTLILADQHPDRVQAVVFIGAAGAQSPDPGNRWFCGKLRSNEGWDRHNVHSIRQDYAGYVHFFMAAMFPEPHSTKQIEDAVGWAMETDAETLIASQLGPIPDADEFRRMARGLRCPVLVIHGTADQQSPHDNGEAMAELCGATFLSIEGSGHAPQLRDPVKVNVATREFIEPPRLRGSTTRRGKVRAKKALFVSSPIGLGHAQRDVAIARELRKKVPDIRIDWLAQDPVTRVLEAEGERIHPASSRLASDSAHMQSESCEHELHCFQAWRRMDEILINNFMVFRDVVNDQDYDLWVGDEAWEIDYYLHENPQEKRAPYAWLTDFVGWLPMEQGGEHEACLTADYNAEMIEHIARLGRVRDRAIFVGNPEDIVDARFGPDLPMIRDWTEENFSFAGYITGFDPDEYVDREKIRHELGYGTEETLCIATVGGSGVGEHLLNRVIASFDQARERIPNLRMVAVAGPRIDPRRFDAREGLEIRPYVHNLYRHLAVCDVAMVQGGLTTSMELAANKRPFLYFPLDNHFEQNFHVPNRLDRYRAGRRMAFNDSTPDVIAGALADELSRELNYRDVERDGAQRAAAMLAEML